MECETLRIKFELSHQKYFSNQKIFEYTSNTKFVCCMRNLIKFSLLSCSPLATLFVTHTRIWFCYLSENELFKFLENWCQKVKSRHESLAPVISCICIYFPFIHKSKLWSGVLWSRIMLYVVWKAVLCIFNR